MCLTTELGERMVQFARSCITVSIGGDGKSRVQFGGLPRLGHKCQIDEIARGHCQILATIGIRQQLLRNTHHMREDGDRKEVVSRAFEPYPALSDDLELQRFSGHIEKGTNSVHVRANIARQCVLVTKHFTEVVLGDVRAQRSISIAIGAEEVDGY